MSCPQVPLYGPDGLELLAVLTSSGPTYLTLPGMDPYTGSLDGVTSVPPGSGGGGDTGEQTEEILGPVTFRPEEDQATLIAEDKPLPSNNQVLIDSSTASAGGFPGITMFARDGSCSHIHYSFPSDCWCGELDFNGPTKEWMIRIGDTPVDGRKAAAFIVNKQRQFWMGSRTDADARYGDFTQSDFDEHPAQAQLEVHSPPENIYQSQVRATVDYLGSDVGASISGGLVNDFYLNQFLIKAEYMGDWSSIVRFGARDTSPTEDVSNNFQGICDVMELHGNGGHFVLPKVQDFADDASAAAALPTRAVYSVGTDLRITP